MRRVWFVMLAAVLATGCSGSSGPELPVNGIVTLDDKPLEKATVMFYPDDKSGGTFGHAQTDSNGKFAVFGLKGQKGMAPGQYKVTVSKAKFFDEPPVGAIVDTEVKDDLQPIYSDPNRTVLSYTVTGDGKPLEIKLDSKRRK
jgi:hypothetical protein